MNWNNAKWVTLVSTPILCLACGGGMTSPDSPESATSEAGPTPTSEAGTSPTSESGGGADVAQASLEIEDTDGDGIPNASDACPNEAETANGMNDSDGCPDSDRVEFVDDKVEFDEKVFFDYDKAKLRDSGKAKLDEIAQIYEEEGDDWSGLVVEGHADQRGPDAYNMELSRERAKAVKTYLADQGIPEKKMDLKAYGEEKPAVESPQGPAEYQDNRRVAFEIQR